ncbi:glycosyltransferase, partial [Sphingomonas sp. CCH9-H8]
MSDAGLELAVVVPTFNESRNVPLMVAALDAALAGRRWEVIFVDDNSPDGT